MTQQNRRHECIYKNTLMQETASPAGVGSRNASTIFAGTHQALGQTIPDN